LRIDKVIAATVLVFAATALYSLAQAGDSAVFVAKALAWLAPFLLASVAFAGYSKASGLDQPIATAFRRNQAVAIVLAALLGSLSPFCSCGVIPIIAGLLQAGVPLAPVMAFWLSSPLMDPEMFLLMTGGIGLEFATAKLIAAAGIGLAAGFTVYLVAHLKFAREPLRAGAKGCGSSACGSAKASSCGTPAPAARVVWRFWTERPRVRVFSDTALETTWFLGRWLTLAFLIESLMVAYLPADTVANWLGGGEWWVVPVSALVGIPAYLNGYAAIPLVHGLLEVGMLPGAGLAFMIGGGVTSIPAAMAVFVTVNRSVFLLYIALGLAGAMATGWLYGAYAAL
jgi:hypothetical protein